MGLSTSFGTRQIDGSFASGERAVVMANMENDECRGVLVRDQDGVGQVGQRSEVHNGTAGSSGSVRPSAVHLLSPSTLAISLYPARTLSLESREAKLSA